VAILRQDCFALRLALGARNDDMIIYYLLCGCFAIWIGSGNLKSIVFENLGDTLGSGF
jgi:hypothetical protein